MVKRWYLLASLLLILSLVFASAQVQAKSQPLTKAQLLKLLQKAADDGNLGRIWSTFSLEEREKVKDVLTIARTEESRTTRITSLKAFNSCRENVVQVTAYNTWGWALWTYYQAINWCWNGSIITSASWYDWGQPYIGGWFWRGNAGNNQITGGTGQRFYTVRSFGYFQACVGNTGCYGEGRPWLYHTATYYGTASGYGSS